MEGEKSRSTRRIVSTVTDLSKMIVGVQTLVLWERDYTAGELGESEIAFFAQDNVAQDNAGNVWELGEYRRKKGTEAPIRASLRSSQVRLQVDALPEPGRRPWLFL